MYVSMCMLSVHMQTLHVHMTLIWDGPFLTYLFGFTVRIKQVLFLLCMCSCAFACTCTHKLVCEVLDHAYVLWVWYVVYEFKYLLILKLFMHECIDIYTILVYSHEQLSMGRHDRKRNAYMQTHAEFYQLFVCAWWYLDASEYCTTCKHTHMQEKHMYLRVCPHDNVHAYDSIFLTMYMHDHSNMIPLLLI